MIALLGGRIVELDPPRVERADVVLDRGHVTRVVPAGVPSRMPEVTKGFSGS